MPVDVDISKVRPTQGWVVIEEIFDANRYHQVEGTEEVLIIHKPYQTNTVIGKVVAIHPDTAEKYSLTEGDRIIYREYAGGRWAFNGVKVLLTPAAAILAKVD